MEDFFATNNSNYNLRGHQFKTAVQRSRTNVRSSFFQPTCCEYLERFLQVQLTTSRIPGRLCRVGRMKAYA